MHPGALKILKFSGGGPLDPPSGRGGPPPTPTPTWQCVPRWRRTAIDTFVPATSNLNKNPQ